MSLLGIDVGSSSVKISAYREDGQTLAVVNHEVAPLHPVPGLWEQDPEGVWQATVLGTAGAYAGRSAAPGPAEGAGHQCVGARELPR